MASGRPWACLEPGVGDALGAGVGDPLGMEGFAPGVGDLGAGDLGGEGLGVLEAGAPEDGDFGAGVGDLGEGVGALGEGTTALNIAPNICVSNGDTLFWSAVVSALVVLSNSVFKSCWMTAALPVAQKMFPGPISIGIPVAHLPKMGLVSKAGV